MVKGTLKKKNRLKKRTKMLAPSLLKSNKFGDLLTKAFRNAITQNKTSLSINDIINTSFIQNDGLLGKTLVAKKRISKSKTPLNFIVYSNQLKRFVPMKFHADGFKNLAQFNAITNFKNKTKKDLDIDSPKVKRFLKLISRKTRRNKN
jgi:hypothetical protein